MKYKTMKEINYMALAKKSANVCKAALMMVLLSVSVCASAQEQNATPASKVDWQVGDTVVIKRESLRYLTGERMSNWVYFVSHPILQIGTKRFPDGVLLNGIMSWVGPNDIMLKGAVAREDSVAQAVVEQKKAEQKKEIDKRAEEVAQMSELQQREIEQQAKLHGEEVLKADTTVAVSKPDTVKTEPEEVIQPESNPDTEVKTKPVSPNYQRFSIGLRGGYANIKAIQDTV